MEAERRSPISVRDYVAADRDACLRLFGGNVPDFFAEVERPEYCDFLDALPGPYFVVEDEQHRVIACGGYAIEPDTGRADLCWGMVKRELQGRGIGRFLLQERLRRMLRAPEVTAVHLDTSQRTRGYYERIGFRVLRVTPNGYAPGLDRCDMRLETGVRNAGLNDS